MKAAAADLDPNFKVPELEGNWAWQDTASWPLHAAGWIHDTEHWTRLPDHAESVVTSAVWTLSRCSTGLYLEFSTDSPFLAASWAVASGTLALPHMPSTSVSGLDLYERTDAGWRMVGAGRPAGQHTSCQILSRDDDTIDRTYRLYLPLYNQLKSLTLGFVPASRVLPRAPKTSPLCVYGTSIVQGGCASRPGMAYPAILGRLLGRPVINLGFSGNGRAEPPLAEILGALRPAAMIIDCLPNLQLDFARQHLEKFLPLLLERLGSTPVMCLEMLNFNEAVFNRARRERLMELNAIQREIVSVCSRQFPDRISVIPGDHLLGEDGEGTVDGIHPTDLGFQRIATHLAATPQLNPFRLPT